MSTIVVNLQWSPNGLHTCAWFMLPLYSQTSETGSNDIKGRLAPHGRPPESAYGTACAYHP